MPEAPLNEREHAILEAVIRTYVETAEPAGSRTVARRFRLGISPATVRNTMSDLEEKGYLYHPHTSAGRVPTDLAYRLYVDGLMDRPRLTAADVDAIRTELAQRHEGAALEHLVRRAAFPREARRGWTKRRGRWSAPGSSSAPTGGTRSRTRARPRSAWPGRGKGRGGRAWRTASSA